MGKKAAVGEVATGTTDGGFKGRLGSAGAQVYKEISEWAQNSYPSALGVGRTGGDGGSACSLDSVPQVPLPPLPNDLVTLSILSTACWVSQEPLLDPRQ